jgi:ankyrin repeat protein
LTDTPTEPALKGVSELSPLIIATTESDYETANALLKAGAQVVAVNRDGRSAIMLLADVHDRCVTSDSLLSLIQLLLSYGANTNL